MSLTIMSCHTNLYLMVGIVLFMVSDTVHGKPKVPCFFIFGDSLVDNGNNNDIATKMKVNYKPYGIDFPGGKPTGRFCNGKTTVDIIAEHLGFEEFIPPYATAKKPWILDGVNYASGSGGIRDETGTQLGACISMNKQLQNHKNTVARFVRLLRGKEQAEDRLKKCLYTVAIGSNDYINNYFLPSYYKTSKRYNPEKYARVLIKQYSTQLKKLYGYGARKVTLVGVGLIGCTPNATAFYGTNGTVCVDKMNHAAQMFNTKLRSLVLKLNMALPEAKFIMVDTLKITPPENVSSPGSGFIDAACCPSIDRYGLCARSKPPCKERGLYLFWDAFHPTEAVNMIQGTRAYKSMYPSDTYPMDISTLVEL